MRGGSVLGLLLVVGACKAQIGDAVIADAEPNDVPPDGLGPWTTPIKIPGASSDLDEDDGTLGDDGRELIFAAEDPTDGYRKHLYTITRADAQTMTWTPPTRLSFDVTGSTEQTPRLSEDGLTLYFASNRAGTTGQLDVWQVGRSTIGGTWGMPILVPGVNSTQNEKWCAPCDGDRYVLISARGGSEDVYEGVLGGAPPVLVAELSTPQGETGTFLTRDCLTVYFASTRSGTNTIYTATRSALGTPWPAPTAVTDFAAIGGAQEDPWRSSDLRTFVFATTIGTASKDIYITTR